MARLLTECLYFTNSNFTAIFKIFGAYVVITSLVSPFIDLMTMSSSSEGGYFLYLFLLSFVHTYLMARFIKFMAFSVSGHPQDQAVPLKVWWRLLIVYFFYGVAVFLGFIALIVPGLYITAKYGFADFEAILNDKPVFSALSESWQDTKGITSRLMLVSAFIIGSQFVLGFILGFIGDASTLLYIMTEIVYGLISTSLTIFMSIVYFRLYSEARSVEEISIEEKA